MSIRLRPTGKPCLRSPRGALLVVAGVVALAMAPATTAYADHTKDLGWYAEEAAVPVTVQFEDVAADGETVLAVGRDGDAETGTAVIYRRVGDAWQAEALTLTAPSVITDVAVSGAEEWAIGTEAGAPIVLKRGESGWTTQPIQKLASAPTSLDVRAGTAIVGDADGNVHVLSAGTVSSENALGAGPINGVAVTGAGTGLAVAGHATFPLFPEPSVRVYTVSAGSKPLPQGTSEPRATGIDMTGLAVAANGAAVALDTAPDGTAATWHRAEDGDWVQDPVVAGATLTAVSSSVGLPDPDDVREVLAGSVGDEGRIWQRDRYKGWDGPWRQVAAGGPKLTGVALTALESGFAVGADGTIVRLWRAPDPEAHAAWQQAEADRIAAEQAAAQQAEADRLAAEQAEADRLAAEQAAAEQAAAEQAAADEAAAEQAAAEQAAAEQAAAEQQTAQASSPPPPPPVEQDEIDMNGVVIDNTDAEQRRESRTGQRLLRNVRAVRRGQRLIVSFRLTAKARVGLTAKRAGRVIAKTGMRTLRKGRRRMVLRFSGRPPSSLKVVVRRVSGARDNR